MLSRTTREFLPQLLLTYARIKRFNQKKDFRDHRNC